MPFSDNRDGAGRHVGGRISSSTPIPESGPARKNEPSITLFVRVAVFVCAEEICGSRRAFTKSQDYKSE